MSTEENKAIVRRFIEEFWGKNDMSVADELAAPTYVVHGSGDDGMNGIEAVKQFVNQVNTDNPGGYAQIEDMIAEGDRVVARVRAVGVTEPWALITIFRLEDGKIVEDWGLVGKPWN